MKRIVFLLVAVAALAGFLASRTSASSNPREQASPVEASPIYGVTIPPGYRHWKMIAAAQLLVPGKIDQLRAQFGNDVPITAYKEVTPPLPDRSLIVAL